MMCTLLPFGVGHEYTSIIEQSLARNCGTTLAVMVNPFRRWFGASRERDGWAAAAEWAQGDGHRFARSRDGSGFVVEPGQGAAGWRLEWGASQRHYIDGPELRLRAEAGPPGDLQMLIATRALMSSLEQQVFEEFTEGKLTRMDDNTPEEMRWLVLYPKVPRAELGVLRERFGALSNLPRAAPLWLDAPLLQQLDASSTWLAADKPLLLVLQRSRLTLRCAQAEEPTPAAMRGALALFGVALAAARRVGAEVMRGTVDAGRPTAWGPPSALPEGDPKPV
jgi:hypothetical protein